MPLYAGDGEEVLDESEAYARAGAGDKGYGRHDLKVKRVGLNCLLGN